MASWRKLLGVAVTRGSVSLLKRQQTRFYGASNAILVDRKPVSHVGSLPLPSFYRFISTGHHVTAAETITQPAQGSETLKASEGEKPQVVEEESSKDPGGETIKKQNPVSWLSFFLLVATAAALLYVFNREKNKRIHELKFKEVDVKYGPSVGKAAIGGPLKLVNHEGKIVTEKDFAGNWTLMYFGFTSCPDICPDELQKMVQAIDIVEKKSGLRIAPLFVSVDPERDTVEQMKEYVQEFHPRLMGLTGSPEDIKQLAKSFRVYYMKTGDEGDDYLVDHSIIMYLMDPTWEFVKFYGKNYTVEELSQGLMDEVKIHEKKNEKESSFDFFRWVKSLSS